MAHFGLNLFCFDAEIRSCWIRWSYRRHPRRRSWSRRCDVYWLFCWCCHPVFYSFSMGFHWFSIDFVSILLRFHGFSINLCINLCINLSAGRAGPEGSEGLQKSSKRWFPVEESWFPIENVDFVKQRFFDCFLLWFGSTFIIFPVIFYRFWKIGVGRTLQLRRKKRRKLERSW